MTEAQQKVVETPVPTKEEDGLLSYAQAAGYFRSDLHNEWSACLCTLVTLLDPSCKPARFLEMLPDHKKDAFDLIDLLNTLANLGHVSDQSYSRVDEVDPRLMPCLFLDAEGMPILLLEKHPDYYKVFKDGTISNMHVDLLNEEKSVIFCFKRRDESRADTSKFMRAGSNYSWFRAVLVRHHPTLVNVLWAEFLLNIISLATPFFILLIYGNVLPGGSVGSLPMIVAGMLMFAGFEGILMRLRSRGLAWMTARMDYIVGNKIFTHLISLPSGLIENASVSSQIARIRAFESIRDMFSGPVFLSLIEMPFVAIAALAIYLIAGPLVLVPLVSIALYSVLFYAVYRMVRQALRLSAKAGAANQQFMIESFEKIRTLRAVGLTRKWEKRHRELSGNEAMQGFHLAWLGMVSETLGHGLTVLTAVATVGFGVSQIWAGAMGPAALVATMILVWRVIMPFYSLCAIVPRIEQMNQAIRQVNSLMDIDNEQSEHVSSARLAQMRGRIDVDHVTVSYGVADADALFKGLTFTARSGDVVVVTGDNGSGKSSLLYILKGLYAPASGAVRVDGFDLRQLNPKDYRRQIAYVPQRSDFFRGTIRDNMMCVNPFATDELIMAAIEFADAGQLVKDLPDGLDTEISRLSGILQVDDLDARLSLARGYLQDSPILLIDELPNSVLSGKAGKNLREYIIAGKGKRTCIMVSYREDLMMLADTAIVLKRGTAPLIGTRELLMDFAHKRKDAA